MITSYDTLPLGIYLDICAISRDESREDVDRQVSIIALLSGESERSILNLPIPQYQQRAAAAEFLRAEPEKLGRPLAKYALGPWSLLPTLDPEKLTTAQYIDFQTFAPAADEKLVELLSVLLVPEGHPYNDGYDVVEVQNAIREHLSVADALALSAFFFKSWLELTTDTLASLEKETRKAGRIKDAAKRQKALEDLARLKKDLRTRSQAVGVGLRRWTS